MHDFGLSTVRRAWLGTHRLPIVPQALEAQLSMLWLPRFGLVCCRPLGSALSDFPTGAVKGSVGAALTVAAVGAADTVQILV